MNIKDLMKSMPQQGKVEWIGLRPVKRGELEAVQQATINTANGLEGDHYSGKSGKRQVTLIQSEHLQMVASILGKNTIDPKLTRRNIVVSGINLLAFNHCRFAIGEEVILETSGYCYPCSRMEDNLGPGGYNAMRGHGGLTSRVIKGGTIRIGDAVKLTEVLEHAKAEG